MTSAIPPASLPPQREEESGVQPLGWLYRYEAKGIQAYVLGTRRLVEVAGGSSIVEGLGETMRQRLPAGAQVIMAAAGSATIQFPSKETLASFAATWPLVLDRTAPGLPIVQAWVPLEATGGSSPTPAAYRRLLRRLEEARNDPPADLPEAGPWIARAGRTGLPAVHVRHDRLEDRATYAKAEERDSALDRRIVAPSGRPFLKDADQFGEGYMAVVHADGNAVGQAIVGGQVPWDRMSQFSAGLRSATEDAVKDAIASLDERLPKATWAELPFRPVVLGGDDLTAVLRAADAIPFTERFLAAFEARTRDRLTGILGRGFSACAGLALVKPSFPFHRAYDLAEALCGAAKRATAASAPNSPGAGSLLFHRVTTAFLADWDDLCAEELSAAGGPGEPRRPGGLSGGPWLVGGGCGGGRPLEGLRHLARCLGALPRGGVREWLRLAHADGPRAGAHWLRMREVATSRSPQGMSELDACMRRLGMDPTTAWDQVGRTAIGDALTWRGLGPSSLEAWGTP